MFEPNCTVTLDMVLLVSGLVLLCLIWSRYGLALLVSYMFSMFWVYSLNAVYLSHLLGTDAFFWSTSFSFGLGLILWGITYALKEHH